MGVLSSFTYDDHDLSAASPTYSFPSSSSTPPPTPGSPGGSIQLSTIFGIVISLVGFVILILAFSCLSKLPCIRRLSSPLSSTSSSPRPRSHHLHDARGRPPRVQHVELTIAGSCTYHRPQRGEEDLPPYDGPRSIAPALPAPPPYSESESESSASAAVELALPQPRLPERAVLRVTNASPPPP